MALPQAKSDALTARIAGLAQAGAGWLGRAQADALTRLAVMGLPVRRDEYWRYTDPASLTRPDAPHAATMDASDETPVFGGIAQVKIVFVDGVFDAARSDILSLDGVEIDRLGTAGSADIHWARDLLRRTGNAGAGAGTAAFGGTEHGVCDRWCADPGYREGDTAYFTDL